MKFLARLLADYLRARAVRRARAEIRAADSLIETCDDVKGQMIEKRNAALIRLAAIEPVNTVARRCGAL
jgi:hypothetical protein